MYAIIKDGRIVNTGALEAMFISNVFPPSGTPEWLEEHDVYEVVTPDYDPQTQVLVGCAPVINGRTVTIHEVADKPQLVEIPVEPVQTIDLSGAVDSAAETFGDTL
jgi:hypothetical protein